MRTVTEDTVIYRFESHMAPALVVEILDMTLADHGVAVTVPGEGLLGHMVEQASTKVIPVRDGVCSFRGISLPIRPMVGVIGVAPDHGAYPTGTPWRHGGNMDTASIGPGATVYLPVAQRGALLALGDCHAVMGDGEVCCSGCEVAATVTLKIDLMRGLGISWEDGYVLSSLAVDLRISQLVDPKKTVRAVIPRNVLSAAALLNG